MNILLTNKSFLKNTIGSWTTRLQKFIHRNPDFFAYILSPDEQADRVLTSVKRKYLTYRFFRDRQLLGRVARDYIRNLSRIRSKHPEAPLNIVIIDDFALVKAVALWKKRNHIQNVSIIYSFHGHLLTGDPAVFPYIDKVLFLTRYGYRDTLRHHFSFPPEVKVIGNGVDSEIFYPLNPGQKESKRRELGLPEDKKIITWLANDRPSKGLPVFRKVMRELNRKYDDLYFLIIGSHQHIEGENIRNVGRIANSQVASYLQISDFYFHTALVREGFGLTIAEALKTGNVVLASALGGIPEVTACCPDRAFLVENPNMVEDWVEAFGRVYQTKFSLLDKESAGKIWNYPDWERRFIHAIDSGNERKF